jgi:hypothetical protein
MRKAISSGVVSGLIAVIAITAVSFSRASPKFIKRNPSPVAMLDDGPLTPHQCALQAKCLWHDEDNKPHWVSLETRKSGIHQAHLPVYQWNSECYQLRQDRFGNPENIWIACPR